MTSAESQSSSSEPEAPTWYGVTRQEILAGLAKAVEKAPDDARVHEVFASLTAMGDQRVFPDPTDGILFSLLAVTAARGDWDSMDQTFGRTRGDLLLAYCTQKTTRQKDLVHLARTRVPDPSRVGELIEDSLMFLWNQLPVAPSDTFPMDKNILYPLRELEQIGRRKHAQRMYEAAILARAIFDVE